MYLLESTTRAVRHIKKWHNIIIIRDSEDIKLSTFLPGSPFKITVTITLKPTTKSKAVNS